jgi:hypothetical protein
MIFTREERKQIYLHALELLSRAEYSAPCPDTAEGYARYVCHAISQSSCVRFDHVWRHFPEVYIFRSTENYGPLWMYDPGSRSCDPKTEEGNQLRQLALIFAAELCDDDSFQNELKELA